MNWYMTESRSCVPAAQGQRFGLAVVLEHELRVAASRNRRLTCGASAACAPRFEMARAADRRASTLPAAREPQRLALHERGETRPACVSLTMR